MYREQTEKKKKEAKSERERESEKKSEHYMECRELKLNANE